MAGPCRVSEYYASCPATPAIKVLQIFTVRKCPRLFASPVFSEFPYICAAVIQTTVMGSQLILKADKDNLNSVMHFLGNDALIYPFIEKEQTIPNVVVIRAVLASVISVVFLQTG